MTTTYFVWIASRSAPPVADAAENQPGRKVTFGIEELPSGPVQHLRDLHVADETARRCNLLIQNNGIQVLIEGEHTIEFVVDKALAKIAQRHRAPQREMN
jgi:hypothetical protein